MAMLMALSTTFCTQSTPLGRSVRCNQQHEYCRSAYGKRKADVQLSGACCQSCICTCPLPSSQQGRMQEKSPPGMRRAHACLQAIAPLAVRIGAGDAP